MIVERSYRHSLVGRDEELSRLQDLLRCRTIAHASDGTTTYSPGNLDKVPSVHCVMLTGTEGIGKTRIAEEAAHEATLQGWDTVWVRGTRSRKEHPYRLWIDILYAARAQGLFQMQEVIRHPHLYYPLGELLPEVQAFLPPGTSPMSLSDQSEPGRLWEAVRALLTLMCTQKPLLIVIDDLHLAPVMSCALLTFLVRHLCCLPILFLCTCQSHALMEHPTLRDVLPDLQRDQDALILSLAPLTDEAICQLAAHLPPQEATGLAHAVAGNPFLATELLRAAYAPTAPLPGSIQTLCDQRMRRVSPACQRLLMRAATLGETFTLEQLCPSNARAAFEEQVLDLLEEALYAGLLTEHEQALPITYTFVPPLLTTALTTPRPQKRGKLLLWFLSLLLIVALLGTGSWRLWYDLTHTPHLIQSTTTFTAVVGQPHLAQQQIQARWLTQDAGPQGEIRYPSGPLPAGHATGDLDFVNMGQNPVTLPSLVLRTPHGIALTFHGPITIPPWPWVVSITGYTVQTGITTLDGFELHGPCCAPQVTVDNRLFALNPPPLVPGVTPSDPLELDAITIGNGEEALVATQFPPLVSPAERLAADSLRCTMLTSMTRTPASIRVVQVTTICRQLAYNLVQLQAQARQHLATQLARTVGRSHQLSGTVVVHVLQTMLTLEGTLLLQVQAQGQWI